MLTWGEKHVTDIEHEHNNNPGDYHLAMIILIVQLEWL